MNKNHCTSDTSIFSSSVPEIYCHFTLPNSSEDKAFELSWYFLSDTKMLIKRDTLKQYSDTGNQYSSLPRPQNGWPLGMYEIKVVSLSGDYSPLIKSFLIEIKN